MDEEEWVEEVDTLDRPRKPSFTSPYTFISHTTETVSSRHALQNDIPVDQIHSAKVYRRNEAVISGFIGCALYSLLASIGSLLLGFLNGGLLLFALHLCTAVYLLFTARQRYYYSKRAPLRFLPVLLMQSVSLLVILIRAVMAGNEFKRIFWLQLGLYGTPELIYFGYWMALVLRSMGVQRCKSILPHYYTYLNLLKWFEFCKSGPIKIQKRTSRNSGEYKRAQSSSLCHVLPSHKSYSRATTVL